MSEGALAPTRSARQTKQNLKDGKEVFYDEERNSEVDAADHSVGDYGSTHSTGSNLVHGHVDEQALGEISEGFCYAMKKHREESFWLFSSFTGLQVFLVGSLGCDLFPCGAIITSP